MNIVCICCLFFYLAHPSFMFRKSIFYVHYSKLCLLNHPILWALLFMVQSTQRYLLVLIYSVIFHLFYANYYAVHTLYCSTDFLAKIYIYISIIYSWKLRVINNHSVDDEMERKIIKATNKYIFIDRWFNADVH